MKNRILPLIFAAMVTAACSAPTDIAYFQDFTPDSETAMSKQSEIRLRPEDKISIIVTCKDPQLSMLFNLPYTTRRLGGSSMVSTAGYSEGISGYTVDSEGCIDFPILGKIFVEGMRREEVEAYVKEELLNRSLTKDAVVTVDFMNLSVSVIGEVNRPGKIAINKDNFSVIDALSGAGDLTIYGKRSNISVLRNEKGKQHKYAIDLCSKDMLNSPVFYLQQNDIIYVEPNDVRMRQSTVNGNNIRTTSFWLSIASLATTISLYFIR